MVVCKSVATLIDLATEALHQQHMVKIYCGPADAEHKCNIKITIMRKVSVGANFAQSWILSHIRSKINEVRSIAHVHDHTSGRTVITLNLWSCSVPGATTSANITKDPDDGDDDDGNDKHSRKHNLNGDFLAGESSGMHGMFSDERDRCNHDSTSPDPKKPRVLQLSPSADQVMASVDVSTQLYNIASDDESSVMGDSWPSSISCPEIDAFEYAPADTAETYKYVLMESLNVVNTCHVKVASLLAGPSDLSIGSPTGESLNNEHEMLGDHSPFSWIDDPALETYARMALDTKMLVIESINFATDRICDIVDTLPPSDDSEELRELHEDLYALYPDYQIFMSA